MSIRCCCLCICVLARANAIACPPFSLHSKVGADAAHCDYNDIQSAIDAVGECRTIIDISREHLYEHQHLSISDKPDLTLQGWGDGVSCADIPGELQFPPYAPPASTAPLVTINGNNDGFGTVLTITGNSHVGLRNLTIAGGLANDSAPGGGIDFDGRGSLYLVNSSVSLNHAGFGAGINMNGSSGPAILTLDSYSQISFNTADVSGGGIRVQGSARLYALRPQTLIGFNHAPNGYGGGVEVLGPARADIGSPGLGGLGVIYGNDAAYGGGIDILTFDDGADAIVRLFTTDAHNPVQMSGNYASHAGGAVYLKPLFGLFGEAQAVFCAYDFRIEDNAAVEGSAIYSDAAYAIDTTSLGGSVALNTDPANFAHACTQTEAPPALGAVACAAQVPCNILAGNKAEDANGNPTAGSTILLQSGASLIADRFSARSNTGAHVLREIGDGIYANAELNDCLLADNTLGAEVIAQTDGADVFLTLDSCTVAGNGIGAPYAFLAPGGFTLRNSIIDQPGRATVDPANDNASEVQYVLTNDRSTLPDTNTILFGEPAFVDAVGGDYHLMRTSLGVDSAPIDLSSNAHGADLDRKPRVVDLPDIATSFGPMDLGAYEIQPACSSVDTIFCNGFDRL